MTIASLTKFAGSCLPVLLAALSVPAQAQSALTVQAMGGAGNSGSISTSNVTYGISGLPLDLSSIYGLSPAVASSYTAFSGINGQVSRSANYTSGPYTNVFGTTLASQAASALASADLPAGQLAISANSHVIDSSNIPAVSTISGASIVYSDTLTFQNPAASSTTLTTVSLSLSSSGSLTAQAAGGAVLFSSGTYLLASDGHGGTAQAWAYIDDSCRQSGCAAVQDNNLNEGSVLAGSLSAGIAGSAPSTPNTSGTDTITSSYSFAGTTGTLYFTLNETAQIAGGGVNFLQAAHIDVLTPASVSWTSTSGQLLTAAAVPEPRTLALMLIGLSGMGLSIRRHTGRSHRG